MPTNVMTNPRTCCFCGHPDSRHRIVDAITERIAAGEEASEVLTDYGMTSSEFEALSTTVATALAAAPEIG